MPTSTLRSIGRLGEWASTTNLGFDQVSFKYVSASQPALADVSFEARSGETIAFVGPSGSGKTTLVKLLVGLYAPQHGRILYNGEAHDRIDK